MATNAQRLADLEAEVAQLRQHVEDLRVESSAQQFLLMAFVQPAGLLPSRPARRTRHLQAVRSMS